MIIIRVHRSQKSLYLRKVTVEFNRGMEKDVARKLANRFHAPRPGKVTLWYKTFPIPCGV